MLYCIRRALGQALLIKFYQYLRPFAQTIFCGFFLLIEGHSALKKQLLIAPFVGCFKKTALGRLPDEFYQYLEQFT